MKLYFESIKKLKNELLDFFEQAIYTCISRSHITFMD